jgi:hypothetical protein
MFALNRVILAATLLFGQQVAFHNLPSDTHIARSQFCHRPPVQRKYRSLRL